ncbi:MAG TPA: DNA polymerase domain-containing protein [Ktedonobacterales bacterium]
MSAAPANPPDPASSMVPPSMATQDEWLWGWDPTPGIVSVWADRDGRALIWRRAPGGGSVTCQRDHFRPWLLLPSLDDLAQLGPRLAAADTPEASAPGAVAYRELSGPGHLRYLVSAARGRLIEDAILAGATARLGHPIARLSELGDDAVLQLPPEEQYLVTTGRTSFRDLAFDDLHRLQFDLETTGLDPNHATIFMVAVRDNRGLERVLDVAESKLEGPAAEADVIRRLVALVRAADPDVIENHNLHGFDLPFLARRAEILRVPLALGRAGPAGLGRRPSSRGYGPWRGEAGEANPGENGPGTNGSGANGPGTNGSGGDRRGPGRFTIVGRELIDTLDAVRRYDFSARDLPGHGLKAVARHFGLAPEGREYVAGAQVYSTWLADPARVRHYALDDVTEAAGLARLLGGAAFALARMAPRRYERLADAGPATGVLDPLIVRAYLRAGAALPARPASTGIPHSGAALYLFAAGVARRIVKADVASLYPSLMRQYAIGPAADRIGALLALVDRLVEQRLAAKARARAAAPGSPERHTDEALSAAMKILVNSAYGYLGAPGLTRFADVHAANEVTRRGREVLGAICRGLAARGATLLEGDTDGVYFSVPDTWTEADERRVVAEVAALLPPLVRLEFEGRYAAMLSHEPKNYALLTYDGQTHLRGVAFRSSRAEPFGEVFLRRAIGALLAGDVPGVRAAYVETVTALRLHALPSDQVAARVRLTKTPAEYEATRSTRREAAYEAMLAVGRTRWERGEHVRIYRAAGGRPLPLLEADGAGADDAGLGASADSSPSDPREYDAAYYIQLLRASFAARLARAFTPDDFAALFDDPRQPSLFAPPLESIHPVLTPITDAPTAD